MPTRSQVLAYINQIRLATPQDPVTATEVADYLESLLNHLTNDGAWDPAASMGGTVNPTVGRLPRRTSTGFADSILSESGSDLTAAGNLSVTGILNGISMTKYMGNAFGSTTYLKIARLKYAEDSANYDNLVVELVMARLWSADHFLVARYIIANRGGTSSANKYRWYITGGKGPLSDNIVAGLLAMRNADNTVDIYIKVSPTYNLVRYNVISRENATLYPSEATTTTTPTGTVEFDATNYATYPPMMYLDNAGNLKLKGSLTQNTTSW